MKLLILGATGGTGLELVEQALEAGDDVTAFVRRPEAMKIRGAKLRIHQGDIMDRAALEAAVSGQDAVLSALGVRKLGRTTILSDGTQNAIDAMRKTGVRRLIVESSLGVGDSKGQLGALFNWFVYPVLLGRIFADKEVQEARVRDSGLEWVIVRPAILTDGPRTGKYRAGFNASNNSIKRKISRADTAEFMLKQVTSDTYLRQTPGLSY